MNLGRLGIWTWALRSISGGELSDTVGEVESLGYGAVWFPGLPVETAFAHAEDLLAASTTMTVATGIAHIWSLPAAEFATANKGLRERHPDRFVLGLGVSHPELINTLEPGRWKGPVGAMRAFLDDLDTADPAGGAPQRILAALGPKMLALAGSRAAGAHPYFTSVEHTAAAREALGPGPVLAPEVAVVLEPDPTLAREAARSYMALYLGLTNYTSNLLRHGFTEEDVAGPTDRLVDAVVPWGDEAAIARRIAEHYDAGADHVCIQVLPRSRDEVRNVPREEWRRLAPAILALA